jgi:hypothetical protein
MRHFRALNSMESIPGDPLIASERTKVIATAYRPIGA